MNKSREINKIFYPEMYLSLYCFHYFNGNLLEKKYCLLVNILRTKMVQWHIVDASYAVCQVTEELGSSFLVEGQDT